jgi:hypothetical protein
LPAQDPRQSDKWKTFFENVDFSSTLDVENHDFEGGRFYPGLIVFMHPDSIARECDIRFSDFADFCDPKKKLEARGNKSFSKADVYCFVFNGNLFMRPSYKQYAIPVGGERWARVVINGPLRVMEQYTKGGYSGRDYSVSKPISKYGNPGPSVESMSIGFCKHAEKLMSESKEIVTRICAKEEGYRPKNFLQIVKEFNDYIKTSDPDLYAKTIAPYFHYIELKE